jgi:5-methyltetrahydrofolate--homocysteine methyltransferase
LLLQSICDRLAEAGTERIHQLVRTEHWGYQPDEQLSIEELFGVKYQGIRPAIGYPSLPDLSLNFTLNELLGMEQLGIRLSEKGAMLPQATVSGLIFARPESYYFSVL